MDMKIKALIAILAIVFVMVVIMGVVYKASAQETRPGATIDSGFLIVPDGNQKPCSKDKPYTLVLHIAENNDTSTGPGWFSFCVGNDEIPSSEVVEYNR
jgi:hypothetical protein